MTFSGKDCPCGQSFLFLCQNDKIKQRNGEQDGGGRDEKSHADRH